MCSPANPFAQRVAHLSAGGEPSAVERRLAVVFDLGDARELTAQQLALAMLASSVLAGRPDYVRAVEEALRGRDEQPEVEAVVTQIDAGETVTRDQIHTAYAAAERRQAGAHGRVAAAAMRGVRPVRRALPRPRCAGGRPRARRTRAQTRSSSRAGDSGDGSSEGGADGPPPASPHPLDLAHGLATCPLCCDEPAFRPRCWPCRGLGFVERELRNRCKRGHR